MNIIKQPNLSNFECPICHTNDSKPITLVSVAGTEDGNKVMAVQVHIDCINITFIEGNNKSVWLVQFIANDWNKFYKKAIGE